MPKSVFVSHVHEDKTHVDRLDRWAKEGRLGEVVVTGETADVRPGGDRAVRDHLSPRLTGAGAVVVLVGQDTHNRQWVDYEVQHALSQNKKVVPVRIPGTTGAAPPALQGVPEVAMEPTAIAKALKS